MIGDDVFTWHVLEPNFSTPSWTWMGVAQHLSGQRPGYELRLEKPLVEHPRDGGLRVGAGLPLGQRVDFRLTLADRRGLHVRDFGTFYLAHIDRTDPACDPLLHLLQDAPKTALGGFAAVGGLLGMVVGRSEGAFALGALIGAAIGVLAVARAQPASSSEEAFEDMATST